MNEDQIISQALEILQRRVERDTFIASSAHDAENFLTLKLSGEEREVFAIMLLDTRHRLIEYKEMFQDTINRANVYPREILKAALFANAAAIILSHNHPSGITEPSQADISLTRELSDLLQRVDVRVLDHIVVGGGRAVSFAQRGLI